MHALATVVKEMQAATREEAAFSFLIWQFSELAEGKWTKEEALHNLNIYRGAVLTRTLTKYGQELAEAHTSLDILHEWTPKLLRALR